MNYWLMKSEPNTFSIDALQRCPQQTTHWEGVRNYQARNFMRDEMKQGDLAFFYHSNCKQPGIVGIVEVVREAYPDHTALDANSPYFDEKSTQEHPRWFMVDVKFIKKFQETITLEIVKQQTALKNMPLVKKGNRLSIMPVTPKEWEHILSLV